MHTIKRFSVVVSLATLSFLTHAERMTLTTIKEFPSSIVNAPPLESEATAEVGNSIISSILKSVKPAVELNEKISNFKVSLTFGTQTLNIEPGVFPYYGENEDGIYYNGKTGLIYIPLSDSNPIQVCHAPGSILCEPAPTLKFGVNLSKAEVDFYTKMSFKKQLVYTGGNKKEINISYREFSNDFARPAFSQELKYDISEDKVIGFRGARFEVINANNTEIRFKVLRHLSQ